MLQLLIKFLIIGMFFIVLITPAPHKKIIRIKQGMNATEIADFLAEENIIKNTKAFLFLLRLTRSSTKLKTGIYNVSSGMNYISLIKKLIRGSDIYVKVTIPEGFTTEQIAQRLFRKKIIEDGEEFIKRVEEKKMRGFLFPETYHFSLQEKIDNVIKIMRRQFFKLFIVSYQERASNMGFTIEQIVALASLIEKEAKFTSERPIISAIFHKRLKKRMYLESCASVLFALGQHKDKLTYNDLEVDSPYNTYRNFGLPPTPICNPGLDSLRAAIYPAKTEYLYFFARGDGAHVFTTTYKEHLSLQKNY